MTIRIGLVGYGVGGRLFHAPYLDASDECHLVGVVARSRERVAEVHADLPGVAVHDSLGALVDAGLDAVVVSTPPHTRVSLVREALGRGIHVVADKPFAPDAATARALVDLAEAHGVVLNVFHNRRWDTDIVTARRVIASGELGRLRRLDLRCDQDDPATLEAGPTGGLLRDLGSHVVDQALHLMGPAVSVSAQLDWHDLPAGTTDVAFTLTLVHHDGAHSHISASKANRLESRELRLLGDEGSYVSDYRDVQVDAIRAGRRPAGARTEWGIEAPERWGRLGTTSTTRTVASAQGDYTRFYDEFARAVREDTPGPVPGIQGVAVLAVLDAARRAAETGTTICLDMPSAIV